MSFRWSGRLSSLDTLFLTLPLRRLNPNGSVVFQLVEFGAGEIRDKRYWIADTDLFWVKKDYASDLKRLTQSKQNIVFMGDSCTEWGTWPTLLTDQLKKTAPSTQVGTTSVGTSGWTTYQGLIQFRRDILPALPKSILIFFGWNDHWRGYGFSDRQMGRLIRISQSDFFKPLEVVQLALRSVLQLRSSSEILRVEPEDFRENLTSMVREAKQNGILPILRKG